MDEAAPVPAWVCAPGVRRLPFLSTFLTDYDLRGLPGPEIRAVLGWGLKSTAAAGRRWAERHDLPYVALEDGFLRSVGLGETGAASLSLIADDLGVYYDARRPSRMETDIAAAPDWLDEAMRIRTRTLIASIVSAGLSKTNLGEPLDRTILQRGQRRILIVDQTASDASIEFGLAGPASFAAMMAATRRDEPDAQLIVKRHPAVAAGRKRGCIAADDLTDVTLLDRNVRPADLLAEVDAVHVVTSGLGFEALLRGVPVRCFGAPFYAGWGATRDEVAVARRGLDRDVEAIAAAALIRQSRYIDPVTGQCCEVEATVERLTRLRDRAGRLGGYWAGVGFAPAKRPAVRRLLNSPLGRMNYFASPRSAVAAAERHGGQVVYWAGKETKAIRRAVTVSAAPVVRMEDGFIRSRGLGSDFIGALSVALDDQGVYYDPSRPSRLETLLRTGTPDIPRLARAERLRRRIVEAGLSKYNLMASTQPDWPADRPRLLVIGQVENDQSILKGCSTIRTNAGLVAAARADHPDAYLVYRNHPDVLAGNRPGRLDASALASVDAVADGLDIIACVEACDALATLTSLAGFEALLRGKRVVTYGRPFYAGWGLTEDRLDFERRGRAVCLDALVHAALLDYPVYVAPNGWPCEAEDLVEALIAASSLPVPAAPRGQIARWWRGVQASLDRTPPPAY